MKNPSISSRRPGFTLLETVIAIGVLAVLLTGFMVVFAPAAAGIKRSISVQEADRLASTLEQELVTLRENEQSAQFATGFDKAYQIINDSMKAKSELIFVYQYRGDPTKQRTDGTYEPYKERESKGKPGDKYVVVPMARRAISLSGGTNTTLKDELDVRVGSVYAVKAKQLVFEKGELVQSKKTEIEDPTPTGDTSTGSTPPVSGKYPEAVIAFSAEFYSLPTSSYDYLKPGGKLDPQKLKNPVFTRNLAVRR